MAEAANLPPRESIPVRAWKTAGSSGFFFLVAGLILAACIVGGLFPQGEDIHPGPGRWGELSVRFVRATGLNSVFSQWWFAVLLAGLGANLAACSLQRWRTIQPGIWVSHIGMLVILAGGMVSVGLGMRGQLVLEKGKVAAEVESPRGRFTLPFGVRLVDFRIEYHHEAGHELLVRDAGGAETTVMLKPGVEVPLSAGLTARLRESYPDFTMGPKGPENNSMNPENPAILLEIRKGVTIQKVFVFERFPLFYRQHGMGADSLPEIYYAYRPPSIKQYISRLEIVEKGAKVAEATVFVNKPFKWLGFKLFQSGYDLSHGTVSILHASRDPGVPLVYLGFIILPLGLLWTLLGRKEQ